MDVLMIDEYVTKPLRKADLDASMSRYVPLVPELGTGDSLEIESMWSFVLTRFYRCVAIARANRQTDAGNFRYLPDIKGVIESSSIEEPQISQFSS